MTLGKWREGTSGASFITLPPAPRGGGALSTPSSPSSSGSVAGGGFVEDYHDSGPPTTVGDERWEGHYFPAVPWPGHTYIITERSSGRPVVRGGDDGRVVLGEPDDDGWDDRRGPRAAAHGRWYCVESNNYLGFQDPQTSRYLGHNIHDAVVATARSIGDWEHLIVRPHPDGGFQLLSKYWISSLMLLTIDADGKSLVRRMHGSTLFDFKKV